MSIQTNWYIITGGPSAGKTKTLDHLAFWGYSIIPEAARILIDNEISYGKTIQDIRKNEGDFQKKCLKMKIDLEERLPVNQITFLERGIPDSVVYYQVAGINADEVYDVIKNQKLYKKVFVLEQLPFQQDYARTEDEQTANKINEELYKAYVNLNYDVITVPIMPIDERVRFILNNI